MWHSGPADKADHGTDRGERGMKRRKERRFDSLRRFTVSELAALAIMLVIVAAVALCGGRGIRADGRQGLASAVFAAMRGSNSLLYIK